MGSLLFAGLSALTARWRVVLVMALIIAIPLMGYLLMDGYRESLEGVFSDMRPDLLVVQSAGSMGEFYGSRLPLSLMADLRTRGANLVVPEIHTVTGTSLDSAILLRGIPLESYTQVEDFRVLAGRPLLPGDAPRLAMVGIQLAQRRSVTAGDTLSIRGRDFQVIGVFSTETYADYEAWIALDEARTLLGWGEDVSVFVIRSGEGISEGEQLPAGAAVVPKGTASGEIRRQWRPLLDLIGLVTQVLGLAAAVSLSNLLWRLAWMHRHELAVFRSLGFSRGSLAAYLLLQALVITLLGYGIGSAGALLVGALTEASTAGISIQADFSLGVLAASLLFALLLALIGSALPVWQLSRLNLAALLRDE